LTWERLWAFGRFDLGQSEADFWRLTPREFALLAERHHERSEWEDLRHAMAPFLTALANSKKGSKWTVEQFMVGRMLRESTRLADPVERQKDLQSKIHAAFSMMAGGSGGTQRR
jgi:hypothetical protein